MLQQSSQTYSSMRSSSEKPAQSRSYHVLQQSQHIHVASSSPYTNLPLGHSASLQFHLKLATFKVFTQRYVSTAGHCSSGYSTGDCFLLLSFQCCLLFYCPLNLFPIFFHPAFSFFGSLTFFLLSILIFSCPVPALCEVSLWLLLQVPV